MRILMISDVYFPRVNGVSTSIQTFRRDLLALGHDVTLIAPAYPDAAEEPDLLRVAARTVPFDPEDRLMSRGRLSSLARGLRSGRFDVVHIQTPFVAHYEGARLARALGIPSVESYHTFFEEYFFHYVPFVPRRWSRWLARRLSRAQCNRVDGLVIPSQAMLDVLRGYGVVTDARVIPTGLDFADMRMGDGRRFRLRYGIAPQRPVLVHVGRVAFEKNIDFLLRVLVQVKRQVPEVLLIIAGEGPALPHLRALSAELALGDGVRFLGYQSRGGDLQDCYCAGDVFVFCSHTETQGLVLLEAMALGVPVVSTARMGAAEIVGAQQGAVVAAENVDDFAGKVVRLLRDRDRRLLLSAQAQTYARRWSSIESARKLIDYYSELAAGKAPVADGVRA